MSSVEGRRKHLFELEEKGNWMFLEDLLTARRWSKYITDDVVKASSALSQRRNGRTEYRLITGGPHSDCTVKLAFKDQRNTLRGTVGSFCSSGASAKPSEVGVHFFGIFFAALNLAVIDTDHARLKCRHRPSSDKLPRVARLMQCV